MSILKISISPSNIIIPAISRLQGCLYSQIQHAAEVSMYKLATSRCVEVIPQSLGIYHGKPPDHDGTARERGVVFHRTIHGEHSISIIYLCLVLPGTMDTSP